MAGPWQRFKGKLLCASYASYVEQSEQVKLAQCWVHTRRNFIEAESLAPSGAAQAIAMIGALYSIGN